jgi:8-oxo-dGTP diphosphatase
MSDVGIRLLTVVVLFHNDRMLLLHRAPWKAFAPNRWTGIGGKVEPSELNDLAKAAARELFEETDLAPAEVSALKLRRTLTFDRPGEGLVCLLYFTAETTSDRVATCNEGSLAWITPLELGELDIIDNSAQVFRLLVNDERTGDRRVHCGIATYDDRGTLVRVSFDPD